VASLMVGVGVKFWWRNRDHYKIQCLVSQRQNYRQSDVLCGEKCKCVDAMYRNI